MGFFTLNAAPWKTAGRNPFDQWLTPAWGTPRGVREELEKAYLTLGMEAGLDFAIANPSPEP